MDKIDVEQVIRKKNARLAKISWFIRWLKKTVHEDEINDFIANNNHLSGVEFITAVLKFFHVNLEIVITHPEKILPQGSYIFAANHPLGGLDGMALIKAVYDMLFKEIKFPVNDILLAIENLESLFIPIDTTGNRQSRDTVIKMKEAYASNQQILIFPAGLVSRKDKGKIEDSQWKKHFIQEAVKFERDVIPVYIDGKNSERFYRLSKWRRFFFLPNIEMLYLPDEMFRQNNKTIRIVIGKPISYKNFNTSAQGWADHVKKKVYELGC
jgi:putative hemolysin